MKEHIIHCPTKKEWEAVKHKLLDMGYGQGDGSLDSHLQCVRTTSSGYIYSATMEYYRELYPHIHITHASEFLKESTNTSNTKPMSMINKLKSALLSEPEKSLRKAGIFDEDGQLTSDGRDFYLQWAIKNDEQFCKMIQEQVKEEDK